MTSGWCGVENLKSILRSMLNIRSLIAYRKFAETTHTFSMNMLLSFGNKSQFGNLYLASAHRIAHALHHQYSLTLYELGQYRNYFSSENLPEKIRMGGATAHKFIGLTNQIIRRSTIKKDFQIGCLSIHFDRHGTEYLNGQNIAQLAKKNLVIHQGWSFRDKYALSKHLDVVRRSLEFKESYRNAARDRFLRMKSDSEFVIGVHVRRGDYKVFCDGRYFFDDDVYLRIAIEAVVAKGLDPSKVVIIGFSNEDLDWPDETAGVRILTERGKWWEDFLGLSLCDLIVGPPSTFSGSAAFAGDASWFQIKDKEQSFKFDSAKKFLESSLNVQSI